MDGPVDLTRDEWRRYQRQTILPELGPAGQARLKAARVLLVGVGGLGSPAALYLAAAGVGTIGLVEFDVVDETNLHRQVLYRTEDVGTSKLVAAAARIQAMNPHVTVERHDGPFTAGNALRLVSDYDVVVDGSDNFPTRYLVNDACVLAHRPNVYGSVSRFEGQVSVMATGSGPCYRCLHPEPPLADLIPSCAEAGVLGVLPGLIGVLQTTEALKLVTGIGEPLVGRLLLYDALRMRFREIVLPKAPDCPICGEHPTISTLVAVGEVCVATGSAPGTPEITAADLAAWRRAHRPHLLIDVREPGEAAICAIDGARLVPLAELGQRADELPRDQPVVLHCKSGVRSARGAALLRARGFDARSLAGGILAWQAQIDPALARY